MRFGFLTEGDTPRGASVANRYHEIIREAQFLEQMGFDFWGCSEQHFTGPVATISAPEVLLGAVAQATSRIKIRTIVFRDAAFQSSDTQRRAVGDARHPVARTDGVRDCARQQRGGRERVQD